MLMIGYTQGADYVIALSTSIVMETQHSIFDVTKALVTNTLPGTWKYVSLGL